MAAKRYTLFKFQTGCRVVIATEVTTMITLILVSPLKLVYNTVNRKQNRTLDFSRKNIK